jgi:hypothetical protein
VRYADPHAGSPISVRLEHEVAVIGLAPEKARAASQKSPFMIAMRVLWEA